MKKYFFYIAVICWTMALIVHLASIADIDLGDKIPYVWGLHIGVFIVFIPALIVLAKYKIEPDTQNNAKSRRKIGLSVLKIFIKSTPTWLILIALVGSIYAFFNFMFSMSLQNGTAEFSEGQYYLQSHGNFIRNITEQEYHQFNANVLRGFSGHWIAFYGFAAAVLFPFKKLTDKIDIEQHNNSKNKENNHDNIVKN